MSGEGPGVSGAALEDHVPDGIEAGLVLPGEAPEGFLGNAFVGDFSVEIEIDDVEPALREDEEAVVSTAPGGNVHAGAGGVGADEEGHAVAVAADVGFGGAFVVASEVEEFESFFRAFGEDVGVGPFLGGRVGDAEEKAGDVVAVVAVEEVSMADGATWEGHGGAEGAVNDVADGDFRSAWLDIGRGVAGDVGAIVSSVGIPGNAVPVEGGGVDEATKRHRDTGLDLVSAGDDGGIEDPEELVGVAVGVAAGAGEGSAGRSAGGIEGDASAFEGRRGGVVERDGVGDDGLGGVTEVDEREGVVDGIEDPGLGGRAVWVGLQGDAPGGMADIDVAEVLTGGGVEKEEPVRAGGGGDEGFVVRADGDGEGGGEGLRGDELFGREGFEVDEGRFGGFVVREIDAGDLVEKGPVLEFGEAVLFGAGSSVDVIAGIGLGDEDGAFGVDGEAVEEGAEGVDGFDEGVGFGVEDEEIFVGNVGVFDDVEDVAD